MIIIDKEKKFFHLRTKKMSYVFRILKMEVLDTYIMESL